MKEQNNELQAMINRYETDVQQMPLKEQELIRIRRDYDNVKKSYQELLAAKQNAAINTSLTINQQDSQFKIVDPAALPVIPAGPPRLIIALVGLGVALLLLFGIPLGLHFVNDSFKFRDEVENDLDLEVLGIVPPMKTPAAKALASRATSTSLVASLVAFFGGSLLIFFIV